MSRHKKAPSEVVEDSAYKAHLKEPFLEAYRRLETIYEAADAAGIDRRTVNRWRDTDAAFSQAFDEVRARYIERLIKKTRDRGELQSDTLAMFHIKQADPSYRDRVQLDLVLGTVKAVVTEISEALRRTLPPDSWAKVEEELHHIIEKQDVPT